MFSAMFFNRCLAVLSRGLARRPGFFLRPSLAVGLAGFGLAAFFLSFPGCAGSQKGGPGMLLAVRDDGRCDRAGKRLEELDLNGDGKTDVWKLYSKTIEAGTQVSVLSCKEVDVNFDGRKDMWIHFDQSGDKVLEEFDLDFDGKIDLWVIYKGGKKVREEMDTTFDGRPDLFRFYEGDKLVRIERSSKQNGKIDTWEFYEGGKLDRIGYDTAGMGKPDRWDRAPDDSMPTEATPTSKPPTLPRIDNSAVDKTSDKTPDQTGGDKAPGKKPNK